MSFMVSLCTFKSKKPQPYVVCDETEVIIFESDVKNLLGDFMPAVDFEL